MNKITIFKIFLILVGIVLVYIGCCTNIQDLRFTFLLISPFLIAFPVLSLILCRNCSYCGLSDVCERSKKVKLIKRIMIFIGFNAEQIEMVPYGYIKHDSYINIYKDIKKSYNNYLNNTKSN